MGLSSYAVQNPIMVVCPICGKQLIRLATHLRNVHNLFYNATQPSTLKEFIRLIKLVPLKAAEWEYLRKHRKQLNDYFDSDKQLSPKLFQILYTSFDRYRSQKGPSLIIRDGLFPASKGVKKPKTPPDQPLPGYVMPETQPTINKMKVTKKNV